MLNIKKISVIALILLLVGVVGSILTIKSIGGGAGITEEVEINETDFANVDVETENAEIEIIPTTGSTATVEFTGNRKNDERYQLNTEVEENTLHIMVKEMRKLLFSFDFSFSSPTLKVYLPEKMYDSVQIETSNGRIQTDGFKINDVHVKTSNGKIELSNIESKEVAAKTSNGSIKLDNVDGVITGKTSNGGMSLITDSLDRAIDLETSNGKIHIQTENEPTNVTFDIKRNNGNVTVFGDSDWNTVFGNGENLIKLKTSNGSITVE